MHSLSPRQIMSSARQSRPVSAPTHQHLVPNKMPDIQKKNQNLLNVKEIKV